MSQQPLQSHLLIIIFWQRSPRKRAPSSHQWPRNNSFSWSATTVVALIVPAVAIDVFESIWAMSSPYSKLKRCRRAQVEACGTTTVTKIQEASRTTKWRKAALLSHTDQSSRQLQPMHQSITNSSKRFLLVTQTQTHRERHKLRHAKNFDSAKLPDRLF